MYMSLSGFQEEPCGFPPWPKSPAEHWHHNPLWLFQPKMLQLSPSTAAPPGSFTVEHLGKIPEDMQE